ncbi:MAG: Rid family hydrolase [Terrimicrobiaceae bacterium]
MAIFSPLKTTLRSIEHPGWVESHLTLECPAGKSEFRDALEELSGASVIGVDVFGTQEQTADMKRLVRQAGIESPVTAVISRAQSGGGLQVQAVSGKAPSPILLDGKIAGYQVGSNGADFCFLGGLTPDNSGSSPEDQTGEVFSKIEKALSAAGMGFNHVIRTWFYNDEILDWYTGFNRVRTGFFHRHAIQRMPASTGIGAPNPAGTALVAKALAVRSDDCSTAVREVRSPLQCDAFAYGSAFSRALEVADARSRTLYISGTASIEPGGKSVHKGDAAGQIRLTMEVVEAILGEAGMDFGDTTRAVGYFRDPEHIAIWNDFSRGLPALPLLAVGCHVCRDDLLFEIELDASSKMDSKGRRGQAYNLHAIQTEPGFSVPVY